MPVSDNRSECGNGANDQPAISIDQDNLVMVAWQANNGRLGYSVWNARGVNKERKSGCLTDEPTASLPRLANSGPGEFWMVSSTSTGEIENVWLEHYRNGEWVSRETPGTGNHAEVYIDSQGKVVTAWCGKDNKINYKSRGNDTEIISDSCNNRPSIFTDSNEIVHIVYRADKWQDNFGVIRQGSAIMETIRKEGGWSEPTFITLVDAKSQQEVVKMANGDVKLLPQPMHSIYNYFMLPKRK
jgi:hypothetical protein